MVTLLRLICAQFALGNGAPVYLGLQAPARVFTELYATAWFPSPHHAPSAAPAALLRRTYISRVLESVQHVEVSLLKLYIRSLLSQRRLFFHPCRLVSQMESMGKQEQW